MSQRGKPSTAHEYDKNDCCIHCGMYRVNVELMSHVCTPDREAIADAKDHIDQDEADKQKWLAAEKEANDHGE